MTIIKFMIADKYIFVGNELIEIRDYYTVNGMRTEYNTCDSKNLCYPFRVRMYNRFNIAQSNTVKSGKYYK